MRKLDNIRNPRYLEYYTNKTQKPWDRVFRAFYLLKHRKNIKCMSISIAPNSVAEDVSDNVVIAGSPAKIIKFKENDKKYSFTMQILFSRIS